MTSNELSEAMKKVSELVHQIYHDSNEGPRLLNRLMQDYPEKRVLGVPEPDEE
jgi:hypothetical protein